MPFAELGERRVYYEVHGEGDPVLLVNGLGADHLAWGLQTEAFRERHRVIVFDNPGVGQTEGPAGAVHDRAVRRRGRGTAAARSASSAPTSSARRWAGRSRSSWRCAIRRSCARCRCTARGAAQTAT